MSSAASAQRRRASPAIGRSSRSPSKKCPSSGSRGGDLAALEGYAERISLAADRHWRLIVAAFSVAFFADALLNAAAKPLWHDEIFTAIMAGLPSVRAIWNAHHAGLDGMPPLNTILTRFVVGAVGVGPVSARIPPMLGVWVFALAAFAIVRARANTIAGLVAMLLIGVSDAAGAAWEARGYGVMLGLFALAMLSWTEAARGRRRTLYLPLLSITLAAAVWAHYYAALGFLPIVAGEIVRALRTRKVDWPVAAALTIAVLLILPLSLHLAFAYSQSSTYFRKTTLAEIPRTFVAVAEAVLGPWGVGVGLLVVAMSAFSYARLPQRFGAAAIPAHEVAAGAAILLIPLWAMLIGLLVAAGAFVPRYAIGAVVGYCVVLALLTSRLPSRAAQLVVVAVLLVGSAFEGIDAPRNRAVISPLDYRPLLMHATFASRPIVVTGTLYLQIWYYAPKAIREQLQYIADPAAALRLIGTDSLEHDYLVLKEWSEVSVEPYDAFVRSHSRFFVYDAETFGWLLPRLREDRAEIAPIGQEFGATLYSVKLSD